MIKVLSFVFVVLLCSGPVAASTYYVATTGNDTTGTGAIDNPYKTIPKAVSVSVAGDTIFVRGGTYTLGSTITISKSGSASARFNLLAYPGERPLLDFSSMATYSSNRGIKLNGSYWYIRGFDIYKAGDNGMFIGGSNNIIEFCTFSENRDTGLQIGSGGSNNSVINCDSYDNKDTTQGNADGFSPKLDVGSGNYFYGCRSWQNSDDGWDGYLRPSNDVSTTLENCWSFHNGYLKDGSPSIGNGNGFKMGGSDTRTLEHNMTLLKCLAFDNRVKGFDQNNNTGSMTLYNCSGFRNGTNYSINRALDSGKTLTIMNCLVLGPLGSIGSFAIQATNSWIAPLHADTVDFTSIDTAGVTGPRQPDGSLPDLPFMHLAQGSDLIDAGTDVGLPYYGTAPDIGCFEYYPPQSVGPDHILPATVHLEQNYPNPFNPSTTIQYELSRSADVLLTVYNVLGQEVGRLIDRHQTAGTHTARLDANRLSAGVYFYRLQVDRFTLTRAMMLIK